jgi:hypothetical protein
METIFGPEWHELTLDAVRAYIVQATAEAEGEPLLWEAKGTKAGRKRGQHRRQAAVSPAARRAVRLTRGTGTAGSIRGAGRGPGDRAPRRAGSGSACTSRSCRTS